MKDIEGKKRGTTTTQTPSWKKKIRSKMWTAWNSFSCQGRKEKYERINGYLHIFHVLHEEDPTFGLQHTSEEEVTHLQMIPL